MHDLEYKSLFERQLNWLDDDDRRMNSFINRRTLWCADRFYRITREEPIDLLMSYAKEKDEPEDLWLFSENYMMITERFFVDPVLGDGNKPTEDMFLCFSRKKRIGEIMIKSVGYDLRDNYNDTSKVTVTITFLQGTPRTITSRHFRCGVLLNTLETYILPNLQ